MFGKLLTHWLTVSSVLILFCVYIIMLGAQGQLQLYIHPRYTLFSLTMAVLGLVLLVVGVVMRLVRPKPRHTNHTHKKPSGISLDINVLVIAVLVLAFLLPARPLSEEIANKRLAEGGSHSTNFVERDTTLPCPNTKPTAVFEWVFSINHYPIHCFEGTRVTLTGMILAPKSANDLPDTMQYFGRLMMSCCTIDAQPKILPLEKHKNKNFPSGTWVRVEGRFIMVIINGTAQLVLQPTSITPTNTPSDPYEYIVR